MLDTRYVFTQVSGYTFPMALAAMTASTWQAGLDFSGKDRGPIVGMKEVVEFYKAWNGEGDFGKWSVDQVDFFGEMTSHLNHRRSCPFILLSFSGISKVDLPFYPLSFDL